MGRGELREWVRGKLPEYMVPWQYVVLEEMPRTANGKLDRKRLPAPEEETRRQAEVEAPRTAVEQIVGGIWEQVLGREGIGWETGFFGLGGHSLLATQVVSRVRSVLGVEMRIAGDVREADVEGVCAGDGEERGGGARKREGASAGASGAEGEMPLSYAQQRLWFLEQLEPGKPGVQPAVWDAADGRSWTRRRCGRSLMEIVRRHEVLRTSFPAEEGEAVQRGGGGRQGAGWDRSGRERGGRRGEELAGKVAEAESGRRFDLSEGAVGEGHGGAEGRAGAGAVGDDAPHRERRMVDGDPGTGVHEFVRGVPGRAPDAAGGVEDPVSRTMRDGSGSG